MATLASLRDLVRREVGGATLNDIDFYMLRTARNFCSQTWYCTRTLEVQMVADTVPYLLIPESDQEEIVGVKSAEWHKTPMLPARSLTILGETGTPIAWFTRKPNEWWPVPYPDDHADLTEIVKIDVAIQPVSAAVELPDDLLLEFDEALADGVISRILAMPAKPWTDAKEAATRKKMYMAKMLRAKGDAMRGHQPFNLQVARRNWAVR